MESKTLCTIFLILFTSLPELTQTKVFEPEQRLSKQVNEEPTKITTTEKELQLHLEIEPTTATSNLQSVVLVPTRPAPSKHVVRKCCKVGEWAAMRGYLCHFDEVYYREYRNLVHRQRMKFQRIGDVPSIDRQVVRKIRRCVDYGLKTMTSRCCSNMVYRLRKWSSR